MKESSTTDIINLKENKKAEEEENGVKDLQIPEIIWLQMQNAFPENLIDYNLQFLSSLMRYGKKLNYKPLKQKIVASMKSSNHKFDPISLEVKITNSLLEKYDDKEYIKKILTKYQKLFQLNPNEKNKIISEMISALNNKIQNSSQLSNLSDSEKDFVNEYILDKIFTDIDFNDIMITNYDKSYNFNILRFLIDNYLIFKKLNNSKINLEDILKSIFIKVIENKNIQSIDEFFVVWKNYIFYSNKDLEVVFDFLIGFISKMSFNSPNNSEFFKKLFKNLCVLIEDDIQLYGISDKIMKYFTKIDLIIKTAKITKLEIIKEVYSGITQIIYSKILNVIPKDALMVINFQEIKNDPSFMECWQVLEFVKNKMKDYLISYSAIKNEVLKKVIYFLIILD
jgi:hypothetical protein